MLGEEVIRVMTNAVRTDANPSIWAGQKSVTCPGRRRTDTGREGAPGHYEDGDPVNLRLGVLDIGDAAVATVNAEIYSAIGQRAKKQSPLAHTMVVTLANGAANSGYIHGEVAFGETTFQVLSSRLTPGCAEHAIADGLTDLISLHGSGPSIR